MPLSTNTATIKRTLMTTKLYICTTGKDADLKEDVASQITAGLGRSSSKWVGNILQVAAGTDTHPTEDSQLIWGRQEDFVGSCIKAINSHLKAFGRPPEFAYLDLEIKPKGPFLQMLEPWPAATILLASVRLRIMSELIRAITGAGINSPPCRCSIWSPAKHQGRGMIADTQIRNAVTILRAVGSNWVSVNAYPRKEGADYFEMADNLLEGWSKITTLVPVIPAFKAENTNPNDTESWWSAFLEVFGCGMIWVKADTAEVATESVAALRPLLPAIDRAFRAHQPG